MIKLFSNETNTPKIKVESKFVLNKANVKDTSSASDFSRDDLLFVKLTFSGLESTQKINQITLQMMCTNAYIDTGVKVVKCNSTSLNKTDLKELASSFTGQEEVIDKTVIFGEGNSLRKPGNQFFTLDLTNALKDETNANPTIMVAISFPYGAGTDFILYSPEQLAENNEICLATMSEVTGLSGLYKYDEHDFGRCGKVSVNLVTGKPFYSHSILSSVSKKLPVSFSIYQNVDNTDGTMHFRNKVVPNFHYRIYKHDDYYVIEDPTGFKNYYKKVEYNDNNKEEVLDELGIKYSIHITRGAVLYQSQLDYSYIYVLEGDETVVHLYDKSDVHMYFLVNSVSAKIQTIDTPLGYSLTYTWSNARLEKIVNSDGEELLVDYTSDGYIRKVSIPSIDRYVDFVEDTVSQALNIRTYYYKKVGTGSSQKITEETLNQVKLQFSANVLTKVIDVATGYYLSITSSSNKKVTSVGKYNSTGNEKEYLTSYKYETKFTKVSDLEGNNLYYHFDNYGRVKTIMDDDARTVTYNYDELENGESRNLIGMSKTQNNARNLIENHSFEDENAFSDKSFTWKKIGSTGTTASIVTDGVLGEKCLKLSAVCSDEAKVYQNIVNPKTGSYVLKGFIKHPNTSGLTSDNVKVGITSTYQVEEKVTVNVNSTTTKTETRTVTYSYNKYATLDFSKDIWYKFETPVLNIPSNAHDISMTVQLIVDHKTTDIYLDDLQLTNSLFFTRHNLIENGYMEFVTSNRPYGWNFENFEDEDVIRTINGSDIHSPILGDKVMRIAPGNIERETIGFKYKVKKMTKKIPITGLAGDQLIFSVFAKGCVTNNVIFRAFIKFTYENKGTKYSMFSFDKHFDNWQMLTRAVVAEDNFSEVTVGIEYDGGSEVLLDCFQLYKDSFGKYYNYDSRGNITEVISGDGTASRISYDDDNKVQEIYSSDGTYFKYSYDTKGRLYSVRDLNGNTVHLYYDSDDRIESTEITSKDGEIITTKTTYDDVNNKETFTNEFGDVFVTAMDYLNRVISHVDSNGLETEFSYNNKSELEKMFAVVNDVTNSNSLTYDNKGNTKTIKAGNGTLYDLEYDTFGRLLYIKCNDNYLEQYQYDSLVSGYRKGQLLKKTFGSNGDYYEFEYNNLGQVTKVKINGATIVEYSYDENGNVYELKDVKNEESLFFTYDLQGNLIKKMTSKEDLISYTYDNLGNVQKVTYNINSAIRSIDYEYDYELNEYTKEGFFNRLSNMFGDEIVVSGQGPKGQFGAQKIYSTCSYIEDSSMGMNVFSFVDKYDFINYKMNTFNSNRTSGVINGKVFSKESWDSRFRYNKTFYMFVKPTGSYAKENIFSFGLLEDLEDGTRNIDIYSHLCFNEDGTLGYYPTDGSVTKPNMDSKVKLNEWNLVGIKLFKANKKYYASIILNEEMFDPFEIDECVEEINYLLVANQANLIVNTSTATSSGTTTGTTSNLNMPFKVCLMSFGAYEYTEVECKAIYNEGLKYLFKEAINKSNATIYYDEKVYDGFDVVTLNGSLESTKGLKPVKIATIDKSYRFDKTRIFKYDEDLQKHVFGCYEGVVNLSSGNTASLVYNLPLKAEGTISLRFKHEEIDNVCNQIFSLYSQTSGEKISIFIDENNEIRVGVGSGVVESTYTKFIQDEKWHHLILRFKSKKLQIYLDKIDEPLYDGNDTIIFNGESLYLGNNYSTKCPLNGCIEMFAFKDSFAEDSEIKKVFAEGKPIIVRNQLDSLGRLSKNKIIINEEEMITEYTYDKTRVSSQTLHNGDVISYTYDSLNNVKTKEFVENGVRLKIEYTYDDLSRLIKETHSNGRVEEFSYYQNGNIQYRTLTEVDGAVTKEEYIYDSTIKDKLVKIINLDTNVNVQNIAYSSKDAFKPTSMIINGESKTLSWEGKRLKGIGDNIQYEYSSDGIRLRKVTPSETTSFELEESKIISMNKVTSTENVILDFVYDASAMLVGLNTVEGNYFYVRDITGNIVGLIDKNGEFVVKYVYDAWGNILNKEMLVDCIVSRHNPFVYKGYFLDSETNFYYLNSRYYDPKMHRFISVDDISYLDPTYLDGVNLYCYCMNNPINYVDIDGHAPKWWQSILIGVGIIVVAALVAAAIVYTGGGAAAFFAAAGKAALGGLKIAAVTGATAGVIRAGKTAIEGGDFEDVGKSLVLGFSDGFLVGSAYAAFTMILGATSFRISGLFNNGEGWTYGNMTGGYKTPKTPGISLLTIKGGINGGRSFGIDLDIYNSLHFHFKWAEYVENRFLKKVFGKVKRHRWAYIPIIIGIGVGLSDGWSEW